MDLETPSNYTSIGFTLPMLAVLRSWSFWDGVNVALLEVTAWITWMVFCSGNAKTWIFHICKKRQISILQEIAFIKRLRLLGIHKISVILRLMSMAPNPWKSRLQSKKHWFLKSWIKSGQTSFRPHMTGNLDWWKIIIWPEEMVGWTEKTIISLGIYFINTSRALYFNGLWLAGFIFGGVRKCSFKPPNPLP